MYRFNSLHSKKICVLKKDADFFVYPHYFKASFKTAEASKVFDVPKMVTFNKDGVRRYSDGNIDIGISKEGDAFKIYDYQTDSLTKEMTRAEVNSVLRSYNGEKLALFEEQQAQIKAAEEMQKSLVEIEDYARENIKDYKKLSAPAQGQIVRIIEDGRAKGVSDSDVLAYAKIAAHSGIDIVFNKEATKVKNKAGEDTYRPAVYEWQKNRITVNPESIKGAESILIHELDHAVRNYFSKDGQRMSKVFNRALAETDKTTQEKILKKSEEVAMPGQLEKVFKDEVNAYYAERMLTNRQTLERIVEAEPGIKDRILSFFKGASTDYADVQKLSGSAKWYYKKFKKMFDDFSARNSEALANEKSLTNMNQENMQVSDRQYAFTNSNSGTAHDSLLQYDDELRSIIENRGDTIIDNYDKLKSTVKNAFEKPDNKSTAFLGIIDTTTLQKIKDNIPNLPKELEGKLFKEGKQYSIAITMDSIRHMVDEKGLSETDIIDYIDKIADVIIDFDSVNFDYYIKGKNKTPGLLFKKSFSDGTIITFDLVSQNKRSLLMQTLYMESSDYQKKKSAKALPMQNASGKTSKTQVGQTSTVIIPENQKNVKGINENSSDKQFALPIDEDGNIPASEVLSWFENKPKGDGKIDLEATVARGLPYRRGKSNLTVGELRKVIANSTHEKVYSKKDALRVVNKFSGSSGLTVKAREEIADTIWQFLNEAPDIEYRADMAQDIAEFIVAKILVDSKTENPDALAAAETLSYLRVGIAGKGTDLVFEKMLDIR